MQNIGNLTQMIDSKNKMEKKNHFLNQVSMKEKELALWAVKFQQLPNQRQSRNDDLILGLRRSAKTGWDSNNNLNNSQERENLFCKKREKKSHNSFIGDISKHKRENSFDKNET